MVILFYLNNVEFVDSPSLLQTLSSGNIRWRSRIKLCKIVLICSNNWDYSNRMSIAAHLYCLFSTCCCCSFHVALHPYYFHAGLVVLVRREGGLLANFGFFLSLRYSFLILFSTIKSHCKRGNRFNNFSSRYTVHIESSMTCSFFNHHSLFHRTRTLQTQPI